MDLTVRDWLMIIGGLLAAAVLLDGFRRMRNDHRDNIRLGSRKRRDEDDDEMTNPELPGGSARVVAVREAPNPPPKPQNKPVISAFKKSRSQPVHSETDIDDDILFVDPEDEYGRPATPRYRDSAPQEPGFGTGFDTDADEHADEPRLQPITALDEDTFDGVEPQTTEFDHLDGPADEADQQDAIAAEPVDTEPAIAQQPETKPLTAELDDEDLDPPLSVAIKPAVIKPAEEQVNLAQGLSARAEERAVQPEAGKRARNSVDHTRRDKQAEEAAEYRELMVLNVVAGDDKPFNGAELLQILLACDVRYGKMNIFHRYEKSDGTGAVQFSIANLVEPGDFDLDNMDQFTTPGLVFFMHLPGPENSIKAFDAMVETARCLVKNLGGELRDQSHSVATKQTLEHFRQRIRDFERRQLTLM